MRRAHASGFPPPPPRRSRARATRKTRSNFKRYASTPSCVFCDFCGHEPCTENSHKRHKIHKNSRTNSGWRAFALFAPFAVQYPVGKPLRRIFHRPPRYKDAMNAKTLVGCGWKTSASSLPSSIALRKPAPAPTASCVRNAPQSAPAITNNWSCFEPTDPKPS